MRSIFSIVRKFAVPCSLAAIVLLTTCIPIAAQSRTATEQATYARGRNLFIVNDCFSCHGWYQVKDERWGDLARKPLVALDTEGNFLIPFLRHGVQCALDLKTPMMPAYWDLSEAQMSDLRAYIHFERQDRQYKQLTSQLPNPSGDASAGKLFFDGQGKCKSCHAPSSLNSAARNWSKADWANNTLRPAHTNDAGLKAHRKQLELYSPEEFQNLLAYLLTLK